MRYYEIANLKEAGPATTSIGQNLEIEGQAPTTGERYTAQNDQVQKKNLGDTRKPKITLRMLNRLKMIRSSKKLEMEQKTKILGIMYGAPPTDNGGGLV